MDSLSYLIENNNDVIIDEKLLHDLQLKNQAQGKEKFAKQQKQAQVSKVTKKYSPMNRPIKRSPQGNKIIKTQTTKVNRSPESRLFNEEESIQLLSAKIENLKQGQHEMQDKYGQIIRNLRNQLSKRNNQYQSQCEQFNQIKNQLNTTKKDIASLIGLLKNSTSRGAENSRRVQSPNPNQNKNKNVLGGFSRSNKEIN